jgi:hypothetical protein
MFSPETASVTCNRWQTAPGFLVLSSVNQFRQVLSIPRTKRRDFPQVFMCFSDGIADADTGIVARQNSMLHS